MPKYVKNLWLGILPMLALAALVGTVSLFGPGQAPPAYAQEANIVADCYDGGVEATLPGEGENIRVVIRAASNDPNAHIAGKWYTDAGTADTSDYQGLFAQFQEGNGKVVGEFATVDDRYPEDPETLTVRFENTLDHGQDAECPVVIYDDEKGIKDVAITSSPADGETYRVGETIEFALTYTDAAEVKYGSALVGFRIGDEGGPTWRTAGYHRGSRSYTLYFRYQVQPGDYDADGISMDGGFVDANGQAHGIGGTGRIVPMLGERLLGSFTPWFRGFGDQEGHKVDARVSVTNLEITSTPPSNGHYVLGDEIELSMTFSHQVVVEGDVLLNLRVGDEEGNWRGAWYRRGSGTDTLVFGYTVQQGDSDTDGVSVDSSWVDENGVRHGHGGSGSISARGSDYAFVPRYSGLGDDADHLVDGVTPIATVTDISVTSDPGLDRTYGVGDVIEVTVTFSEDVTVDDVAAADRPQLTLDFNLDSRTATFASQNENRVVFTYRVQVGDKDVNGISINENSLSHNQGAIRGPSGYLANLTHNAVSTLRNHRVRAPGGL